MSAAVNTAVFDALDTNHDGVISRAEFGGASVGASVGVPVAAPAVTYSASPVTYAAPQAVTYAAPQMTYAAPQAVTYAAPQMTYAAPQAVTYAAPPAVEYADAFSAMDTNHDGVISRAEFAGSVAAPTYGAPAYSYGAPAYAAPTYGAPQAYTGGGAYTQGKVYEPVLFTQESFLAYQTQGAASLPAPEASVVAIAATAVSDAPAKAAETKDVVVPAKKASSKKAKKASKKKKGCC